MSYLVLARKWRPNTFDDLVGQEPIARILKNALSQSRISHAYIFSGPRGVGKTTTARILAKAMNCKEGPTAAPCGVCESCIGVTEGSSVDVIEIDGASNNSVDDIRDLRERVKYAPAGGKYKVYIIDEVHMLSGSAFNALLKTLEEPPSHVIFVLATTEMKKIPATVLSRCQHMPFKRIPSGVIKARLSHIAESEAIAISSHALGLIAKAADGSMRDSLTILDQISSFSDDITEEQVQNLLGMTDFSMLTATARALISGDRLALIDIINSLSEQGADFRAFTKELAQFFRDLLVARVVKTPGEMLELSSDELSAVLGLIAAASVDQLTLMLSEIMKAEAEVRNASLPRMALELALIRASFLSSLKPVKEIIEKLDRLSRQMPPDEGSIAEISGYEQQSVSETVADSPANADTEEEIDEPPISAGNGQQEKDVPDEITRTLNSPAAIDIETAWKKVLNTIDPPLASKLDHASIELKQDQLNVILNGGQAVFLDTISRNIREIQTILSSHAGRNITINLSAQQKKPSRKRDLKEKALSEPVVKEALELFEGRIVDVTPIEENRTMQSGGDDV